MAIVIRLESSEAHHTIESPVQSFFQREVTIGRAPDNDLVLADPMVSGHHAKIQVRSAGPNKRPGVILVDIGSTNGTFLEEQRLAPSAEIVIEPSHRVVMGPFILRIAATVDPEIENPLVSVEPEVTPEEEPVVSPQMETIDVRSEELAPPVVAPAEPLVATPAVEWEEELRVKSAIREQLIQRLDLRRQDIMTLPPEELRQRAQTVVEQILLDMRWDLPVGLDREHLIRQVLDEALGLGPLEELLAEEDCSEIMVNSFDQIYAERSGKLRLTSLRFSSEQAVLAAIERILAPIGRRIDESSPIVDARLKDGSRVNAVIRPLALNGPCITIRKFSKTPLRIDDLVQFGSMSRGMAEFLRVAVDNRLNVVISGGTGSGKTTLLNVISSFIPAEQRVITVEDAAELQLSQEHVVRFETRPPNLEGKGAIAIRDLVKNALRMRPDRIIVGECRGPEALDMLQAMNTGHDGSMTTGHANTPTDMLRRLETMVLMAGLDMPVRAIREQIASAVNLVVQQTRFGCGTRKVTAISEVVGLDPDEGTLLLQDIFVFRQDGYDENGKIHGSHQATGYVPRFFRKLQERGIPVDAGIFSV